MDPLWACPPSTIERYGSRCEQASEGEHEVGRCERYCIKAEDVRAFLKDMSIASVSYPMAFTWSPLDPQWAAKQADFLQYVHQRKELAYRHVRNVSLGSPTESISAFTERIYRLAGGARQELGAAYSPRGVVVAATISIPEDPSSTGERYNAARDKIRLAKAEGKLAVVPISLSEDRVNSHAAILLYNPRGFQTSYGGSADVLYIDPNTTCTYCADEVGVFMRDVVQSEWGLSTEKVSNWVEAGFAQEKELGDSGLCYMWVHYLALPILLHADEPLDVILAELQHLTTRYRGVYSLMMGYNLYSTLFRTELDAAHSLIGAWIEEGEKIVTAWKKSVADRSALDGGTSAMVLGRAIHLDKWHPRQPFELARQLDSIYIHLLRPRATPNLAQGLIDFVAGLDHPVYLSATSTGQSVCGVM